MRNRVVKGSKEQSLEVHHFVLCPSSKRVCVCVCVLMWLISTCVQVCQYMWCVFMNEESMVGLYMYLATVYEYTHVCACMRNNIGVCICMHT